MKHLEFELKTFDGLSLYGQSWQPEEQSKAVICLVHGLGEHSGRYAQVADRLTKAGYTLFSFDWRGHGRSDGQPGHTPSYEALLADIDSLLTEAEKYFPSLPRFLYGFSLAGNLVLNYGLRRKPVLQGIIAIGPWLRLAFEPSVFRMILARVTNQLWPSFSQVRGLDSNDLFRDPEVIRDYKSDPLVHDRISARMFMSISQAGQWALNHASEFSLPLLLMHGGEDRIISAEASREFAEQVTKNCTFKIWDGLHHAIHDEPEKEEVLQFLIDWLDKQV
jgi:alpha-beta hydrolase superfamily lysophospholipase